MKRNIEDLTTELIRLPKGERLEIVRFLLFLDNRSLDSDNIDSAWEKEITDRVCIKKGRGHKKGTGSKGRGQVFYYKVFHKVSINVPKIEDVA